MLILMIEFLFKLLLMWFVLYLSTDAPFLFLSFTQVQFNGGHSSDLEAQPRPQSVLEVNICLLL